MSEKADAGIAEAVIENAKLPSLACIVIRLPLEMIPFAYLGAVDVGNVAPGWKVTNARAFAKEVVHALNDEDEDGTTPIHRLFDAAFEEAIEQGAEGVEEDPVCGECNMPKRVCICTPEDGGPP